MLLGKLLGLGVSSWWELTVVFRVPSLETNIVPENQWLVQMTFPFVAPECLFSGVFAVTFRECNCLDLYRYPNIKVHDGSCCHSSFLPHLAGRHLNERAQQQPEEVGFKNAEIILRHLVKPLPKCEYLTPNRLFLYACGVELYAI